MAVVETFSAEACISDANYPSWPPSWNTLCPEVGMCNRSSTSPPLACCAILGRVATLCILRWMHSSPCGVSSLEVVTAVSFFFRTNGGEAGAAKGSKTNSRTAIVRVLPSCS